MRRLLIGSTLALLLLAVATSTAAAITVTPSVVGVNRPITITTPLGTCTWTTQLVILNPIVLPLPRPGIGAASLAGFNCPAGVTLTPLPTAALGFGWEIELTSTLGTLPLIAGALFTMNVAFSITAMGMNCLYSGTVGYLIAQGGNTKTLLANRLIASPAPICAGTGNLSGVALQLSSAMRIL
ncbi:MAG: hypothetical protein WBD40_24635 [Tepidisphaeraceae bacterium]